MVGKNKGIFDISLCLHVISIEVIASSKDPNERKNPSVRILSPRVHKPKHTGGHGSCLCVPALPLVI